MVPFESPFLTAAQDAGGAEALVAPHRTLTYAELADGIAHVARNAHRQGATDHEPVAVALPPGAATAEILLGLAHSAAVAFPVNPTFPAEFCASRLEDAGARHLVAPYGVCSTPQLRKRIVLSPRTLLDDSATDVPRPKPHPDAPAVIILTSGLSGPPKAAALSMRNLVANAVASNRNLPLEQGDRWLLSLPLYHVAAWGVLFRCAAARAAVVAPRSDEDIAQAVERYEVTHLSLVGTQLHRLLQTDAGRGALRHAKAVLLGGSAIPPALIDQALDLGVSLYTSYGMTEMASQVTTTPPAATREQLLTSGMPIIPGNLRLNDAGEIEVAGDTLFLGYLRPGGFERPVSELGWFKTGDLGAWTEDGFLNVTGRRDNMFVVSGENVQPEEVERCIVAYEGVLEAKVVPVNDDERTHIPVAFVRMAEGAELNEAALTEHVRARLPKHCVPRHIAPWPRTFGESSVKVRRDEWLEAAAKAAGR